MQVGNVLSRRGLSHKRRLTLGLDSRRRYHLPGQWKAAAGLAFGPSRYHCQRSRLTRDRIRQDEHVLVSGEFVGANEVDPSC